MIEVVLGIAPDAEHRVLGNLYWFAVLLPSLAVWVRRLGGVRFEDFEGVFALQDTVWTTSRLPLSTA